MNVHSYPILFLQNGPLTTKTSVPGCFRPPLAANVQRIGLMIDLLPLGSEGPQGPTARFEVYGLCLLWKALGGYWRPALEGL